MKKNTCVKADCPKKTKKTLLKEAIEKLNELFVMLLDNECYSEAKSIQETITDLVDNLEYSD